MTDIDFDELDREVNKLVKADTPQDDTTTPTSQENIQDKPDTTQGDDQPASDTASTSPPRPRGRFMDVMHPSSDMTTETDSSQSDQLASTPDRKTLEPLDDGSVSEVKTEDDNSEKESDDHSPSSHMDMPDPIDFHEARTTESKEDTQEEVLPSEEKESELPQSPILPLDNELSSLFNETEVEKRPLGQFSQKEEKEPTVTIDSIDGEKVDSNSTTYDKQEGESSLQTGTPEDQPVDLPPELEKDLVAIEAGESPDTIFSPVEEKNEEEKQEEEKPIDTKEDKEVSTSAALLASGSIPQQYKIALKEKVSREGDHALFDSSHYDKAPAKVSSKKKSGHKALLQWIFIVIGLLLLGSTIGAGLFVFVSTQ